MFEPIDAYCERIDAGLWSEPVNAVTNVAFLIAAAVLWRRSAGLSRARLLCGILAAIGIGSGLFHTFAQGWAALADVVPILGFILVFIFAVNRDVLRLRFWPAVLLAAGFVPFAMVTVPLFQHVPVLGVSAAYLPVPALIVIYAGLLWPRFIAKGFLLGAGLLLLSLTARSLDESLCGVIPVGTHFLWHILNAVMLGWMIEVYCRTVREA